MADERMIPSTFSLTPQQTAALRAESKRRGVSFGEVMRRIVDEWMDEAASKPGLTRAYNSPR